MKILITGVGGLIGSATAILAKSMGWDVVGIENDSRGRWFGESGSVVWRLRELWDRHITVHTRDFRDSLAFVKGVDVVLHCASQPSHDFSREHVLLDSAVNYTGTVELLEAVRQYAPEAVFIFLSTNKVYGDAINYLERKIVGERFELHEDYFLPIGVNASRGIDEDFGIDNTLHTPFGVSKTAADLMVQEYRNCFGMQTVSLRCGCLTGIGGSAVQLHGFLGYLVASAVQGRSYTVFGYDGYQVRDNLDSRDLAHAIMLIAREPKRGVYNLGGGRENSVSIREALTYVGIDHFHQGPARLGDHAWWITDTTRFEEDYPTWTRIDIWRMLDEMVKHERDRRANERGPAVIPPGIDSKEGI